MKSNSKLVRAAIRLWPNSHGRYKEMCALAATAQLGGKEMSELNAHISTCDSCREFLWSLGQVSVQVMPLLAENGAPAADIVPPDGMRDRFLSRIASEESVNEINGGARQYPFLLKELPSSTIGKAQGGEQARQVEPPVSQPESRPFWLLSRSAAAMALCVIVGIAGFYAGVWRGKHTPQQPTQMQTPSTDASARNSVVGDSDHLSQLEGEKSQLENTLAKLKQELSILQSEKQSLSDELTSAKDKLTALTMQANSASEHSSAELQDAQNRVATLQSRVDVLSERFAESEVKLSLQRQMSEDLVAKLDTTEEELRRQNDLRSAKLELGDLVATRNLHIVDVYDADSNGKRDRSFGRVFYVEGKSLVFYAYDLGAPGQFKANVVFHVWGEKAGVKEVAHSLGILHKDDGQNRWAMTFDDPSVLVKINSAFVTTEVASKHYNEPHGKKVLYAYWGNQPNHP
jgi:predicted  nucleic acid-binding Zn-ribbon protein